MSNGNRKSRRAAEREERRNRRPENVAAEQKRKKEEPAEMLSDMKALQAKDASAHTPIIREQTARPYRYFRYEYYARDMRVTDALRRQAQTLLGKIKKPDFTIDVGYEAGHGAEEMIGEAILLQDDYSLRDVFRVNIIFGRDHIIRSACSAWGCPNAYPGGMGKCCVHQAAGLILLENYLKEHNPGDATNLSGISLLEQLRPAGKNEDTDQVPPSITIEPYLIQDEESLDLMFRAGGGRLYKIKSLHQFVKTVREQGEMTFGKDTTLTLGRDYIKPDSMKWMTFLEECITDEEAQLGRMKQSWRYGDSYLDTIARSKDKIGLTGLTLDRFFDAALGSAVETTIKEPARKNKRMLRFREKDLSVTMNLRVEREQASGIIHGIILSGDLPVMLKGTRRSYYIDDDGFNALPAARAAALAPILSAEHGGFARIMIGRARLGEFYRRILPGLREVVHIEVSDEDEAAIEEVLPPEPEFISYLDVDSGNILGRCDVYYDGARFNVLDLMKRTFAMQSGSLRNYERENDLLELMLRYFQFYDESYDVLFTPKNDERLFDFLDRGVGELLRKGEVRMTDRFKALKIRGRSRFDVRLSVESNLLDLEVLSTELMPEELLDILLGYQKKKRFVRLKNGDFFRIDENESITRLAEMMDALRVSPKEFVSGKMHIPAYRALYLDRMLEASQDLYATRDRRFKDLIKAFKTVGEAEYELPASLAGIMRKYQQTGYRWLRTLDAYGFGGILADDMGLGKTLEAIALLLAVKEENPAARPSMVVCPASLVFNWQEEIRRFAPTLRVQPVTGAVRERAGLIDGWMEADVLVTSYDLLKRDIAEYEGKRFRFVIADEAQYIKNYNTAAAKSVKLLDADTRFALTGTPIENHLGELWSIFDFLMPGLLYTRDSFRTDIETPVVKYQDETVREKLQHMVTPFILRRRKKEVLKDLPEKLEETRYARMDTAQQRLYDGQVVRMKKKLTESNEEDFRRGKIEILAELMHIRQICCDPGLLFEDYTGGSAKRNLCLDLIDSLIEGEHRALVFSQFTSMLEKLEEDLNKRGIPYFKITGATPKEKRMTLVREFNEGDVPIFLISLKAGGTGLNLTGADVVIHYDPWWNTAVQDQATDRAHRIGQTKVVNVYRLIVKGTIEEKIMEMQAQKSRLADDILSASGVSTATLSKEDLMALLS